MRLALGDGKLREHHEVAVIEIIAFRLIGIAMLERRQDAALGRAHLDQGDDVGVDPLDLGLNGISIIVGPQRVEARHLQRKLARVRLSQDFGRAAGEMRPHADADEARNQQRERHDVPPARREPADGESQRHQRKLQGDLREDVEGDPQLPEAGGGKPQQPEQHAKLALETAPAPALLFQHRGVRRALFRFQAVSRVAHDASPSGQRRRLSIGRICSGAPKPGSASKRFFQLETWG